MTLNENTVPVANEIVNPNAIVANPNPPSAPISVKVSFGNDIRRVTFNGASFVPLRDLVAGLFVLDPVTTVVKYQDEDEDKITMSSDGELQEALRLSKGTLRLFVESKAQQQEPAAQDPTPQEGFPQVGQTPFWHGPFRGRHGFGGHHGGHGHPHGGRGGFGGPWGSFGGRGGFGPHYGGRFGCASDSPAGPFTHAWGHPHGNGPVASFGGHPFVAQGHFSPASEIKQEAGECAPMSPDRKSFKERKLAFKQTVANMKANAVTKDDIKAIKKYKEEMKEEFKSFKRQCERREKHEKHDKHDRHDKYEKHWSKHHEKGERLMSRHVADVTIPDNSELAPDTAVVKTWKLKNPGTLAWPAGCQLLFISHAGDQLSGPERVVLNDTVLPQQEVDVSVPLLTPGEPGRYVGYYRMATPDGVKFGQRVWVSFVIPPQANTTTAPSAPIAMDQ